LPPHIPRGDVETSCGNTVGAGLSSNFRESQHMAFRTPLSMIFRGMLFREASSQDVDSLRGPANSVESHASCELSWQPSNQPSLFSHRRPLSTKILLCHRRQAVSGIHSRQREHASPKSVVQGYGISIRGLSLSAVTRSNNATDQVEVGGESWLHFFGVSFRLLSTPESSSVRWDRRSRSTKHAGALRNDSGKQHELRRDED
jgi:hypothetical protein